MQGTRRALVFLPLVFALAGCGHGDGGSTASPPPKSGTLDATYGVAGRIAVSSNNIAVDRAGNAFVGGEGIRKFDVAGRSAADFVDGGPTFAGFVTVDAAGNVYTIHIAADLHFILARRDATGRLVQSFGQGGLVDLNAVRPILGVDKMFVDGAGNVYVQGSWHPPTSARPVIIFLMKLDADGRPVASFGEGANASLQLPSNFDLAAPGVTVDDGGNVFSTVPASAGNLVVAAFDPNGRPVSGFRAEPIALPCAQWSLRSPLVKRDSAGNVYVGASCGTGARELIFVAKLDAAGNPVTAFGAGGVAADFFMAGSAQSAIAALQPAADGGLYVVAHDPANECAGVAIVKLGTDGKLVDAFGANGVARLDLAVGLMMSVDSSGRLYVGGRDRPTTCPRLLGTQLGYSVYRLNG